MTRSTHHSFDIDLAAEYSIEEAILIHHFQYWIGFNQRLKKNLFKGRRWTYQTILEIAAHFPYFSKKQVERILVKLVEKDIMVKGNFNKSPYDRTVWYAFKDEALWIKDLSREETQPTDPHDIPESGNQNPGIGTPIPDTIPDTENTTATTDGNSSSSSQDEEIKKCMSDAGINQKTQESSMRFSQERIKIALYNTKLKKNPDDASGYFFDQLKNGYCKKSTKETREQEEIERKQAFTEEVDRRRAYVTSVADGEKVVARSNTFEIRRGIVMSLSGYLEPAFGHFFPGYFEKDA